MHLDVRGLADDQIHGIERNMRLNAEPIQMNAVDYKYASESTNVCIVLPWRFQFADHLYKEHTVYRIQKEERSKINVIFKI